MGKKRVHELAKELGLDNKVVLEKLQAAGLDVKSHSSSVYEDEAMAVLQKPAEPTPAPAGVRRAGMMIVKKKKDVEAEAQALADEESAGYDNEASQDEESVAVAAQDTDDAQTDQGHDEPAIEASTEASSDESQKDDNAPASDSVAASSEQPAGQAPAAPETKMVPVSGATSTTPGPTAPARPGAAQVVRMIDREKLMERVPSRRLGGGSGSPRPGGGPTRPGMGGGPARPGVGGQRPAAGAPGAAPGQRFGQVTELKVVTDPFGRGREMVNVGRDNKKKAGGGAASKVGKKDRAPSKRNMMDNYERANHPSRLRKKKTLRSGVKKQEITERKASKRVIRMKEKIVVADLAHQLGVKVSDIISKLMSLGMMVTQNQSIDFETTQLVSADYEYTVDSTAFDEQGALDLLPEGTEPAENLKTRAPVVTVMGHVDHGKTSLLDAIRSARVASGEAGGITQHIGAYQVTVPGKGTITFLDTPGHAAFTAMRARGAQVTDLVILVVAADDGVMPQTEEAIKHAQAAKVPIIVAVNKIDKPDAQADRVMQELTKFQLVPEAWGGETMFVSTSATQGTGINELLEGILLQAEVLELKANPDRQAIGVVLEAQLDKGRGPVATILVQQGTLKRGDAIVAGEFYGKVRAMVDDTGKTLTEAGPSAAVEITGIEGVPEAGDTVHAVETPEKAREVIEHRLGQKRAVADGARAAMSLEDIMKRMKSAEQLELKVVLKADVQGSAEALREALSNLSTEEVKCSVILSSVGAIKESDVSLAAASKGIVVGFNVRPDNNARLVGERDGVDIRTYTVIYEALDEIRKAMEGLLAPETKERVIGQADVREVFRITKVGQVAGCRVMSGKALRSARVRVLRNGAKMFDGKISSIKHFKNDVREVDAGQECGVTVDGYSDVKQGDALEFYIVEEFARTLTPLAPAGVKRPSPPSAHP